MHTSRKTIAAKVSGRGIRHLLINRWINLGWKLQCTQGKIY